MALSCALYFIMRSLHLVLVMRALEAPAYLAYPTGSQFLLCVCTMCMFAGMAIST